MGKPLDERISFSSSDGSPVNYTESGTEKLVDTIKLDGIGKFEIKFRAVLKDNEIINIGKNENVVIDTLYDNSSIKFRIMENMSGDGTSENPYWFSSNCDNLFDEVKVEGSDIDFYNPEYKYYIYKNSDELSNKIADITASENAVWDYSGEPVMSGDITDGMNISVNSLEDGNYVFIKYVYHNQSELSSVTPYYFNIDTHAPEVINVKSGSENGFVKSVINCISFGVFFKDKAVLSIEASDNMSGLESGEVYYNNTSKALILEDNKFSFAIDSKYTGEIKFVFRDKAGNVSDEYILSASDNNNIELVKQDSGKTNEQKMTVLEIGKDIPDEFSVNMVLGNGEQSYNYDENKWVNDSITMTAVCNAFPSQVNYYQYKTAVWNDETQKFEWSEFWQDMPESSQTVKHNEKNQNGEEVFINDCITASSYSQYKFRAVSNSGNTKESKVVTLNISQQKPEQYYSLKINNTDSCVNGWYTENPVLEFSYDGNKPSMPPTKLCYKLYYKSGDSSEFKEISNDITDKDFVDYVNSIELALGDGFYYTEYWTEDSAGNKSDISRYPENDYIQVCKSVPGSPSYSAVTFTDDGKEEGEIASGTWTNKNIKIKLNAPDEKTVSGISHYEYKIGSDENSQWKKFDFPNNTITISSEKVNEVYHFRSVSNNGKVSGDTELNNGNGISSFHAKIWKIAPDNPKIDYPKMTNDIWYTSYDQTITLTKPEQDNNEDKPGIKTINYQLYHNGSAISEDDDGYAKVQSTENNQEPINIRDDIIAEDGYYEICYWAVDEAGNESFDHFDKNGKPVHRKLEFKISTQDPTIKINIDDGDDRTMWEEFRDTIFFQYPYKDGQTFKVEADYHNDDGNMAKGVKLSYQKLSYGEQAYNYEEDKWEDFDNVDGEFTSASLYIGDNESAMIYVKAENEAGRYTIINSDGIVIDKKFPVGENNSPDITISPQGQSVNDYYNDSVSVNIFVEDPPDKNGARSGLKYVGYTITTPKNGESEPVEIYSQPNYDKDNIKYAIPHTITIDKKEYNTNDITIKVTAIDFAGNNSDDNPEAENSKTIHIDADKPVVSVEYDSDNKDENNLYFNHDRKAVITVDDRNFDIENTKVIVDGNNVNNPALWTSNGNIHKANVVFSIDGNHTFDLECVDKAGNSSTGKDIKYTGKQCNSFVIDKTPPKISPNFDNNHLRNGKYYNNDRNLTINVTEAHFNTESAKKNIKITAKTQTPEGEKNIDIPLGEWENTGNLYFIKIPFIENASYDISYQFTDDAGNVSENVKHSFIIDKLPPEYAISGLEETAYNDELEPVISYSDLNLDEKSVKIKLTGGNLTDEEIDIDYGELTESDSELDSESESEEFGINGKIIKKIIKNFEDTENSELDGIYTLSFEASDMAGNSVNKQIKFSVNRFGSSYEMTEDTTDFVKRCYNQRPSNIVIHEVNVNSVSSQLTLTYNRDISTLEKDKDYSVEENNDNGRKNYTYTINADKFSKNGEYVLMIQSKDEANNNMTSRDNKNKKCNISFVIDNEPPTCQFIDLESDKIYKTDSKNVNFVVEDNIDIKDLKLKLNNEEVKLSQNNDDNKSYSFTISSSNEKQSVNLVCIDSAGNKTETNIKNILVTNDTVTIANENNIFLYVIIGAVILVISGVIVFIVLRKKKKMI